jgi:5-methylcytosine-specific restriction enzyme A
MPSKPPTACACGGVRRNGKCNRCGKQHSYDKRRGTAAQRGYGADWRKARRLYLHDNPLCVQCLKDGKTVAATVVDHIVPHRGDMVAFWVRSNWQALCKRHHNIKTGRGE